MAGPRVKEPEETAPVPQPKKAGPIKTDLSIKPQPAGGLIDWDQAKQSNFIKTTTVNRYLDISGRRWKIEHKPIAAGETYDAQDPKQVGAKTGENLQTAPADAALRTVYYQNGVDAKGEPNWSVYSRQLDARDTVEFYSLAGIVKDGLGQYIENAASGRTKKKTRTLDEGQMDALAAEMWTRFSAWVSSKSDESTPDETDQVETGPSTNQIIAGIRSQERLSASTREGLEARIQQRLDAARNEKEAKETARGREALTPVKTIGEPREKGGEGGGYGSGEGMRGASNVVSLASDVERIVQLIGDYIAPQALMESAPGYSGRDEITAINDVYTLTQYLQYVRYEAVERLRDLFKGAQELLSEGTIPYQEPSAFTKSGYERFVARVREMEVGLGADGQPYVLIDSATYAQMTKMRGEPLSPYRNLVCDKRPEGAVPLWSGTRMGPDWDSPWEVRTQLPSGSETTLIEGIAPLMERNRQDFLNLVEQTHAPTRSVKYPDLVRGCGRLDAAVLEADPQVSSGLHRIALDKMRQQGGKPEETEWTERQLFYSLSGYCTEQHLLTFGLYSKVRPVPHMGAVTEWTVRVIDESTGIMGEAVLGNDMSRERLTDPQARRKACREAVDDLARNIYSPRGFYSIHTNKQAGQSGGTHYQTAAVYQTPWYRETIREAGGYLSLGLLSGNPYVAGVGLGGWLASNIEKSISRSERERHTGQGLTGTDYADMATQMLILSARLPLWWARAASAGEKMEAGAQAIGGASRAIPAFRTALGGQLIGGSAKAKFWFGSTIAMGLSASTYTHHMEGESEYAKAHLDGRALTCALAADQTTEALIARFPLEALPEDFDARAFIFEKRLAPILSWARGQTTTAAQTRQAWESALNQALLSPQAYGEPLPMGTSIENSGAWQALMLERNGAWIDAHRPFVALLAGKLGWATEDVCLAILMYGGPRIENTEIETLAAISDIAPTLFGAAARKLAAMPNTGATYSAEAIEDDLKLQFMTGRMRLSQIQQLAQ